MFGAHSVLPSCTTGLPTEAPTQSPYIPSGKSSNVHCHYIMLNAYSVPPSYTTGLPTEQTPDGTSSKSSIVHCHCIVLDAHSVPPPYTTGLLTEQPTYGTSSKSSIVHCKCKHILFIAHSVPPSCTTGVPTEAPTESPYGPSGNNSIFLITTTLYLVLILYHLHAPQVYQHRLPHKVQLQILVCNGGGTSTPFIYLCYR